VGSRHSRSRIVGWVVIALTTATVVGYWSLHQWTWSTIDDPGFVIDLHARMAREGWLAGTASFVGKNVNGDLTWGLFRPAYWVYPLVYALPSALIHLMRLGMLAAAIGGPLVYLRRRGSTWVVTTMAAALLLLASTQLTPGLFFSSLQELSGAAFVGLGLLLRRDRWRTLSWLVAAWFKSPFAWLLIGQAIVLWRSGRRRDALVSAGLGAGTLMISYLFARQGSYTTRYFRANWYAVLDTSYRNSKNLVGITTCLVLVALLWWLVTTATPMLWSPMAAIVAVGWLGYTAQMLLWEVSGYYFGPILYLFGVAVALLLSEPAGLPPWRLAAVLVPPLLLSLVAFGGAIQQVLENNEIVRDIQACLTSKPGSTVVMTGDSPNIVTPEGSLRIVQNVQLEHADWTGRLSTSADAASDPNSPPADVFLGVLGAKPAGEATPLPCSTSRVAAYSLTR
jgi:hypothetical protein